MKSLGNATTERGTQSVSILHKARRAQVIGAAWLLIWLVSLTHAVYGQGANDVTIQDLPISNRCTLPAQVLHIEPLPPQHPRLPQPAPQRASKENRSSKYDVSRIGSRGIGRGINLYSIDRERALGHELATETDAESRMFRDGRVVEYVNRIAQDLVRHSDAKVPFTVKVIDSDEINAFTLPGGYLYVNSGLLVAVENEAELAGVLAHEIAHVAARHATKNVTRRQIFGLAAVPLSFIGGGAAIAITQAMNVAEPLSLLKFSRDAEREADLLGLEYVYAAGYDPAEFVRFFERMRKLTHEKKSSFVARAFSTHPITDDRIHRAQQEISTLLPPKDQYVITTSEFEEIKTRVARLRSLERQVSQEAPLLRRRTAEDTRRQPGQGGVEVPR